MALVWIPCFYLITVALTSSPSYGLSRGDSLLELDPFESKKLDAIKNKPETAYVIFQAHSQDQNITLTEEDPSHHSRRRPLSGRRSVTGTNIGLVKILPKTGDDVYVWIYNPNSHIVRIALIVKSHSEKDPIPGGCNLEFPTKIAPYLRLSGNFVLNLLEYQRASLMEPGQQTQESCEISDKVITYEAYVYYLPDDDKSEEAYFAAIKVMSDVDSMRAVANKVRTYLIHPVTKILAFAYPNRGVVYNVIATYNGLSTPYVPVAAYQQTCDSNKSCHRLKTLFSVMLTIACGVFGLVVCFHGHTQFYLQTSFFGMLAGSAITFVLLGRLTDFSSMEKHLLIAVGGVLGGSLWSLIYALLKSKTLSSTLSGLILGFLITSSILFSEIGNDELLRNDVNFWIVIGCGMLLTPILLIPFGVLMGIFSCSIVGAHTVVAAIDHCIGGSISYIVINVLKRGVYDEIYLASNQVPLQTSDIILICIWALLAIFGTYIQLRNAMIAENENSYNEHLWRPPPPPPQVMRKSTKDILKYKSSKYRDPTRTVRNTGLGHVYVNETQPLLSEANSRDLPPRYDAVA